MHASVPPPLPRAAVRASGWAATDESSSRSRAQRSAQFIACTSRSKRTRRARIEEAAPPSSPLLGQLTSRRPLTTWSTPRLPGSGVLRRRAYPSSFSLGVGRVRVLNPHCAQVPHCPLTAATPAIEEGATDGEVVVGVDAGVGEESWERAVLLANLDSALKACADPPPAYTPQIRHHLARRRVVAPASALSPYACGRRMRRRPRVHLCL